ncbi:MAG TPA: DNA-binding protein [Lysobacter sp.]
MQNAKAIRPRPPSAEARAKAIAALDARGQSVAEFAREHDLQPGTVYQVLSGEKKGRRGEAHRAAVLLGLKQGVA